MNNRNKPGKSGSKGPENTFHSESCLGEIAQPPRIMAVGGN
jgi:hypothetical protein